MELLIYFSLNDLSTLVTEQTNGMYMRTDNREPEAVAPTVSAVCHSECHCFIHDGPEVSRCRAQRAHGIVVSYTDVCHNNGLKSTIDVSLMCNRPQ